MKGSFSLQDAFAEPFRIAFGRPVTTMIWGLLQILPVFVAFAGMAPLLSEMVASGAFDPEALERAASPHYAENFAAWMQLQMFVALSNLLQGLALLLITTAIIRTVFSGGRKSRFFGLRIGMDELRVALIGIAVCVGLIVLMFAGTLLLLGVMFGLAQASPEAAAVGGIVMGLGAIVGFFLIWGRIGLMAPAAVHYGGFGFEEGWRLGRGQSWKLLLLQLLLFLLAIVVFLVILGVFFLTMLVLAGGMDETQQVVLWQGRLAPSGLLAALGLMLLPLIAWLHGLSALWFTAPFARAAKQLAESQARSIAADVEAGAG